MTAPAQHDLQRVAYEDVCATVPLEDLTVTSGNAIAQIAPSRTVETTPPHDSAGLVHADAPPEPHPSRFAESWWNKPIDTPALYAACLHDAVCFGGRIRKISAGRHEFGQLLVAGDRYLVPDSYYVRGRSRSLPNGILDVDAKLGRYVLNADLAPLTTRPGLHYLVGSAHGHFGHFLLEGLSRLWLLERLHESDLQFVVYEPELVDWQLATLEAAGVPEDRIVLVGEPTRFERLIVPGRAYNLHVTSSAEQDRLWERIGDACEDDRPPTQIYCSRSRWRRNRKLLGEEAIDELFADRGFHVVHPHLLDMREKIALARSAERIAGPVGSGTYLAAFQRRGASSFIISPPGFAFRDDHLIAEFRQSLLWYFMTEDVEDPSAPPRDADYRVDVPRLASAVDRWLEQPLG